MTLLVPCSICGVDVPVDLVPDSGNYRAPDLLPNINTHVISVYEVGVSGM
jgi:hypothetical protein